MRRGVSALVVFVVLALAAVASAATPTRASWARGADKLCGAEIRALQAIPKPAQGDVAATSAYFRKIVATSKPYTTKISQLPRPTSELSLIRSWVQASHAIEADALGVARSVDAHDSVAAGRWLSKMMGDGHRADTIALRLGAKICASG